MRTSGQSVSVTVNNCQGSKLYTVRDMGRTTSYCGGPGYVHELFDEQCFLFRGVPDIVFCSVKFDEVTMVGSGENPDDCEADSDVSDHSARCEMGNRNEKSYIKGSSIVEKGGELVASMHLSLVCQALRRIVRGDKFGEVSTHGLLIHRHTAVSHLIVTLSMSRLRVQVNVLVDGHLTKEVLCNSFNYLTEVIQHK